MFKHYLSFISLLLATYFCVSCNNNEKITAFNVDGVSYILQPGNEVSVWSCDTLYSDSIMVIPDSVVYEGVTYAVTSIMDNANFNHWIKGVVIPNSVTYIGKEAFYRCQNIESVVIPNSVKTIGEDVFGHCTGLTSVVIPNSVTTIGENAFWGCSGLKSVVIPNSVTTIGSGAFADCTGLTSIVIPNSVTTIGECAFDGCSGLTSVVIPNSVTTIGIGAFKECSGLKSVEIADGVDCIKMRAFYGCEALADIRIPNNIKIGAFAFHNTAWWNSQPDGVVYIDKFLYSYKGKMPRNMSITTKEGTTQVCEGAFMYCPELASITIGSSVEYIGGRLFSEGGIVESIVVDIANTVYDSRGNCNAIIATATNLLVSGCKNTVIPNSVTAIGDWAFDGCSGLTSVVIPNSVITIGSGAFSYCSGLTSVVIGYGVTIIGSSAFSRCSGLTSVVIPNSVTTIGDSAFDGCSGLTSVVIPNSVTTIGDWAFEDCSGLTELVIGESVSSIGVAAFWGCTSLNRVTSLIAPDRLYMATGVFCEEELLHCMLYVPSGSKEIYKNKRGWNFFGGIVELRHF